MPKIKKNIYTIVFEHNCEKKYYNLKMKHEGIIYAIEYWAISHCEKLAVSNCTALVCISERDQRDIFKYYNRKADALLPVSFENSFKKNKIQPNYKKELLFIGSNFGPNLEGILWFVDNVMSELRDFKLYIVGKNFENEKEKLKRLNVEVIGTVNSMEKYYYSFPVMVMPIFYGSGMKVKTAEAMMYGKTILATDEALEGYDVEDIDGIFRCNTKDDFINTIRSIFTENLSQFRQSVYNLYLEKYSREKTYDILKSIMPSEDKKDE